MNDVQPRVIFWFKIYAAILGCISVLFMLAGIASMLFRSLGDHPSTKVESYIEDGLFKVEGFIGGWIFSAIILTFAIACFLPFFCKPRPWLWIYSLMLIALGFTNCCTLPLCIWLLIYWIKPEVRTFYGRT